MEIKQIETEVKKMCERIMEKKEFVHIQKLSFDSFDPETKTLTFYADDAITAHRLSYRYSTVLVETLETVVGEPANIICKYRPAFSAPHERFKVQRETAQ